MTTLVYSSSLAAAFLGGILALFAPCCIVSLMPAYLASVLQQGGWRLIRITALFAAGVALVLLPVVLGIGALGQRIGEYHQAVDAVVGLLLVALGMVTWQGRGWVLPIPMLRTAVGLGGGNAASVLLVGMISGIASACCAPVVLGVLALTALAPSLLTALSIAITYVFGMVLPLFLAAIFWERLKLDQGSFRRIGMRRLRLGNWSPRLTDAVSGGMFLTMGTMALVFAAAGRSTYTPDALYSFDQWAAGRAAALVNTLQVLPVAVQGAIVLSLAVAIGWCSWHGRSPSQRNPISPPDGQADHQPRR